jgi:hypothetical protein
LTFGEPQTEGTEEIEQCKITLTEAYDMVMRGVITDGDTSLLVMKAVALNEKRQ